jgi:hypothetical protein
LRAGERTQARIGVGASTAFNSTSILIDMTAGTVAKFGGTPASFGLAALGGGWFRAWMVVQSIAAGTCNYQSMPCASGASTCSGDGVSGVYADAVQCEVVATATSGPSAYIACPTTATVTVTDYSATAAGVVTMGQAPVAGAALTWGGTGQTIANPTADATAAFPDDVYFIEQRTTETREVVEFQLAAAFDFQGLQLPRRPIIQNVCIWKYRGPECGYTGSNYDVNDNRIADTDSANDVCSKRLSGCQCRFGTSAPLPYGAFPAAGGIHV